MYRRQLLRSSLILAGASAFQRIPVFGNSTAHTPLATSSLEYFTHIEPFRIGFPPSRIKDLHRRLEATAWPDLPVDTGWKAGTNDKVLKNLVTYWRNEYNWQTQQRKLNQLPQYTTMVDGERLHFVKYDATGTKKPYPLLVLHGWPSSFLEFTTVAPRLSKATGDHDSFDVIVPSLPGFVFSDAPAKSGLHPPAVADRLHHLMKQLGYTKYGVVGGDRGYIVGRELARRHPDAVVKLLLDGTDVRSDLPEKGATGEEQRFIDSWKKFEADGVAYAQIHSTKPQTLSYGLSDSPVGLLAWVLEKYWEWTDHGDDLFATLDRDYILDTVTLYWLSGCILSSIRYYYEFSQYLLASPDNSKVEVPTRWMAFAKNPWAAPDALTDKSLYKNFQGYGYYDKGGHFPAIEVPDVWLKEVFTFFHSSQ